ncbi:hypothetical protein EV06_0846 [Prochlorococcus sp. MIT 0602]|nr:hypothetical protein EV06_0846 [Prochlorococcus sp. MIT 0602]KGG17255.1 hypothetical protein EV07_0693 [Prochlorococcus sp. MIT 0603]
MGLEKAGGLYSICTLSTLSVGKGPTRNQENLMTVNINR